METAQGDSLPKIILEHKQEERTPELEYTS